MKLSLINDAGYDLCEGREVPAGVAPFVTGLAESEELQQAVAELRYCERFLVLLHKWGTVRLKDRYSDKSPVPVEQLPIDTKSVSREELARAMADCNFLKRMISSSGNYADTIGSNFDELSRALGDTMLEEELEKFTQDGVNFKFVKDEYYSMEKGAESEAFQWLRMHGLGGIIKPQVHYATLNGALSAWTVEPDPEAPSQEAAELDDGFVIMQFVDRLTDAQNDLRDAVSTIREQGSPTALDLPPDELFKKHSVVKAKITKQ